MRCTQGQGLSQILGFRASGVPRLSLGSKGFLRVTL